MASKKYIRVALLGDGGVGKTSLLNRYLKSEFKENMRLTVFMNCETKKVLFQENEEYTLFLYDFGGQDRFHFMLDDVKRIKPNVVLLTFDLTDMETFLKVAKYHELINNGREHKTEVLLVGSKSDLEQYRNVPMEKIKAFCDSKNIHDYVEVSAKTGDMINPLFQKVVECHVNNGKNQHMVSSAEDDWNNLTGHTRKTHRQTSLESHWCT
jgi:small GTP-binding protein